MLIKGDLVCLSMAYAPSEIWDRWEDPNFKFFINRKGGIKKRMKFLLRDENMKDEYLGACLDYIRWGGQTTVMYELGATGMINFIQHWMYLNQDNLIWNHITLSTELSLPYVKHKRCPRNKNHGGTIKDLGGRIRCAHKSEKKLKPHFIFKFEHFDNLTQLDEIEYSDHNPQDYAPEDKKLLERFSREKRTESVVDVCYAILSDEKRVLSLEKILDRLNLEPRTKTVFCYDQFSRCKRVDELNKSDKEVYELLGCCIGHEEENDETVHPFSGWKLAQYVQKWYEQVSNGTAPVFEK